MIEIERRVAKREGDKEKIERNSHRRRKVDNTHTHTHNSTTLNQWRIVCLKGIVQAQLHGTWGGYKVSRG